MDFAAIAHLLVRRSWARRAAFHVYTAYKELGVEAHMHYAWD
jgi:hypothetical protein